MLKQSCAMPRFESARRLKEETVQRHGPFVQSGSRSALRSAPDVPAAPNHRTNPNQASRQQHHTSRLRHHDCRRPDELKVRRDNVFETTVCSLTCSAINNPRGVRRVIGWQTIESIKFQVEAIEAKPSAVNREAKIVQ